MERFNTYTKDGKMTDIILVRGEPIPDGLYRIVSDILVRHTDGSYLAMRRSATKSSYAGWLETAAGGAAIVGETPLDCAIRELREETGIVCEEMTEIATSITERNHTIYHCFFCTVDIDKNSVTLQEGETDEFFWMTEEEFIDFVNSDRMIPPQKRRLWSYFQQLGYAK